MITPYAPSLPLRAARDRYFADNGFGPDGGYASPWVDFKLGPLPMPFPNTAARVRAVRFHDLHHILTGYATDLGGELDISAWELGAGCKDFFAAWQLNLGGLAAGAVTMPRRTFRAFVRGRRMESLYGRDFEAILDRTVGEVRAECGIDAAPTAAAPVTSPVTSPVAAPVTSPQRARPSDYALFAAAGVAGLVVGLAFLPTIAVAGPLLFLAGRLAGKVPPSPPLVDSPAPR